MQKVLVIEDTPDNMILISDILQLNGYQVIGAENGLLGFDMAKTEAPDFVLLDIQLPDIDGFEVLRKIRAEAITESLPVIAMTSFAMSDDRKKLLDAGCDGYIEKPIDPANVMTQIQQYLPTH
ncbi:MAG: response regulator [Gammaproteobacteria bacterium]|nr:response regulator [Gammaproteobacteria bacterium]